MFLDPLKFTWKFLYPLKLDLSGYPLEKWWTRNKSIWQTVYLCLVVENWE